MLTGPKKVRRTKSYPFLRAASFIWDMVRTLLRHHIHMLKGHTIFQPPLDVSR